MAHLVTLLLDLLNDSHAARDGGYRQLNKLLNNPEDLAEGPARTR